MIKTIKVKKSFRLDELLKYVWDNELNRIEAVSSSGRFKLKFIDNKSILVNSESTLGPFGSTVSLSTTEWEIEVEEEIAEDTVFEDITVVYKVNSRDETGHFYNSTLKDVKKARNLLSAYIPLGGKLQLIWEVE